MSNESARKAAERIKAEFRRIGGWVNEDDIEKIIVEEAAACQAVAPPGDKAGKLIGNLLTRWELMTNDFKSVVDEQEREFYAAMHELVKAVDAGDFFIEPGAAPAVSTPRCPKCGSSKVTVDFGRLHAGCNESNCMTYTNRQWLFQQFFQPAPSPPRICGMPYEGGSCKLPSSHIGAHGRTSPQGENR